MPPPPPCTIHKIYLFVFLSSFFSAVFYWCFLSLSLTISSLSIDSLFLLFAFISVKSLCYCWWNSHYTSTSSAGDMKGKGHENVKVVNLIGSKGRVESPSYRSVTQSTMYRWLQYSYLLTSSLPILNHLCSFHDTELFGLFAEIWPFVWTKFCQCWSVNTILIFLLWFASCDWSDDQWVRPGLRGSVSLYHWSGNIALFLCSITAQMFRYFLLSWCWKEKNAWGG